MDRGRVPNTFENFQPLVFPNRHWLDWSSLPEAATFIRQFSACESASRQSAHILGLSAAGHIWFWDYVRTHALNVKLLFESFPEENLDPTRVKGVAASSKHGAAYITGRGIVIWDLDILDVIPPAMTFLAPSTIISGTAYHRQYTVHDKENSSDDSASIGEVQHFILLSCDLLVFYTHLK